MGANDLPPLPSKSVLMVMLFLLLQMVWVPVQRLLNLEVVEGWDCSTQIGVNYLRFSFDNDLEHARKCIQTTTALSNKGNKEPLIDIEENGFRGTFIGSEPTSDHAAIILYLHGGGYSLCEVRTYLAGLLDIRKAIRSVTKQDVCLFGLEYSLAPEAKFPTQINEAVAAYKYLRHLFPAHPLFVMGDSAGGNLALALIQELKQGNLLQPTATILISPWTETSSDFTEPCRHSDKDWIKCPLHDLTVRYLPEPVTEKSVQNPLVSPVFGDFSQTCPIFIHYGEYEALAPQIEKLIKVLRERDVDLVTVKEPLAPHITPLLATFFKEMGNNGIKAIAEYVASKLPE